MIYILNATIILILTFTIFGKGQGYRNLFQEKLSTELDTYKICYDRNIGNETIIAYDSWLYYSCKVWLRKRREFVNSSNVNQKDNNNFIIDIGANIGFYTILF